MEIIPISIDDRKSVLELYRAVTNHLKENGSDQWNRFYPNRWVIGKDLKMENLYGIKVDNTVIGAVVVNDKQSDKYSSVQWTDQEGIPACIHRLAVHPKHQGKGIGKVLLSFAEEKAQKDGFSSIRLDVYSANPEALGMYRRANYKEMGEIMFPFRKVPYYCFEKVLQN